jgi:hypothetical protein
MLQVISSINAHEALRERGVQTHPGGKRKRKKLLGKALTVSG